MNSLASLTDSEFQELDSWFSELTTRQKDTVINSFSTKFAYHIVRLMDECEQILMTHTLDLEKSREVLKAIRRGDWTFEQIESYMNGKLASLETVYVESKLRHSPDEKMIKIILDSCLEEHYGSLSGLINTNDRTPALVRELEAIMRKYR